MGALTCSVTDLGCALQPRTPGLKRSAGSASQVAGTTGTRHHTWINMVTLTIYCYFSQTWQDSTSPPAAPSHSREQAPGSLPCHVSLLFLQR
uniref:Uncharacterized protein n=1 Tax=Strix occidentalis caurina TaxID=311401 RepID=A0A8D0EG96_STROC